MSEAIAATQVASSSPTPSENTPSSDNFDADAYFAQNAEKKSDSLEPKEWWDKEDLGIGEESEAETPPDKTFKLKVDGKEEEATLTDLIAEAQQFRAAKNALQQAREFRNQLKEEKAKVNQMGNTLNAVANVFKSGNLDQIATVFNSLGVNFDQLAVAHTKALYEEDMLPPDQKEARKLKKQLDESNRRTKSLEEEQNKQLYNYQLQQAQVHLETEIPTAIKQVGLNGNPNVVRRIAEVWANALRNGQSVTALQVAQFVKNEREQSGLIDINADAEEILKRLGPKAKEIQKKLSPQPRYEAGDKSRTVEPETKTKGGYILEKDWKKMRGLKR